MPTKIISRRPRRAVGHGADHEKIKLSENQINPYLAKPTDFVVADPGEGVNRETPAHGQHGKTKRDHKKLLEKARRAKGKSLLSE
jgi:hypothetical protein